MADKLDVAARLGEARPAVENTQSYVWACRLVNYDNADLTANPAQIHDWFGSEVGLDLQALDADCTALQEVSVLIEEALQLQRAQASALATAWSGQGGGAADEFLRRHCESAAAAAAKVQSAGETLTTLRDTLWQLVDGKVTSVISIDDRRQAERPTWLAAAQTVITGVGDRAVASETVDQQVKPYVDNDIRGDWLTTVRATVAAVGGIYDAAIAALAGGPQVQFSVPGDFGPEWVPQSRDDSGPSYPAPSAGPSAAAPVSSTAPSPAMAAPAAPMMPASPPSPVMPAAGFPAAMPGSAGMPAAAPPMPANPFGDLPSLGEQIADALGGLVPSADAGLPEPELGDPNGIDEPVEEASEDEPDEGPDDAAAIDEKECEPTKVAPPPDPVAEPVVVPPPPLGPPPEPDIPPPQPPTDTSTPCEIAGDELPQAGQ